MSASDLKAMVEALGLPAAVIVFVWFLLLKNGGLKTIFRDELREEIQELKNAVRDLSTEVHQMSKELAFLQGKSEKD